VYEGQPGSDRVAAGISGGVCVNHLWPVVAGGGGMKDEELKEADVLIIAESHGIDPNTKGLYGFYIDCISNQPAAQPAVPDAIHHTDLSESLEYIEGWNDCRAEMLKGMKP
jgi:hypothetical protein